MLGLSRRVKGPTSKKLEVSDARSPLSRLVCFGPPVPARLRCRCPVPTAVTETAIERRPTSRSPCRPVHSSPSPPPGPRLCSLW